jgi:hypothetical protein
LTSMTARRRYPALWRIEEDRESYVVADSLGQSLAHAYFEGEPIRRCITARLNRDDAWQLARGDHAHTDVASTRLRLREAPVFGMRRGGA